MTGRPCDQTSPVSSTLKPCPFCGSAPVTERTGFSLRAMYIYCINDNGCPRPKAIGETEDKAIENWNLRFDHAQTPDLREALTVNQRLLKTIYRLNTHGSVNEHDWENGGVGDLISKQINANRAVLAASPDTSTDRGGK